MENKIIVALLLLVAGLLGVGNLIKPTFKQFRHSMTEDDLQRDFQEFQWKYGKVYNDEAEEARRFETFKLTVKRITDYNNKKNGVTLKMNHFGDLTDDEFIQTYLREDTLPIDQSRVKASKVANRPKKVDHVGTIDWDGVHDQGGCGSCYAFAAVQAIEGSAAKHEKEFKQFSIQEIVDCAYDYGCDGGFREKVFEWVTANEGLCYSYEYASPYKAERLECKKTECKKHFEYSIKYIAIPTKKVQELLNYLAVAPISAGIDASQYDFRYYSTGIIKDAGFSSMNHGIHPVGYDEDEGYIRVKNSWGNTWGEKGYFRVAIAEGQGPLGINIKANLPQYEGEF